MVAKHLAQGVCLSDTLGGESARAGERIDDEETEKQEDARPGARDQRPFGHQPIQHRAGTFQANERREHTGQDDKDADDA